MSGIVLSAATRASLLSAQDTASLLATTQNRLATGKKVASALDNPTNFFTSSGLDNRAGDLSSLLDSIGNGVQTIQAASTGITNIQKLVDSAKSIANQALSDKSVGSTGTAATAATFTAATSYQGGAYASGGTQDFSTSNAKATFTLALGSGAAQTINLDKASLIGAAPDLTKVTGSDIVSAINDQINNNTALAGKVTASLTGDGRLTFSTTGTGSAQKITATAASTTTIDIGLGTDTQAAANATAVGGGTALTGTTDFSGTLSKTFDIYDGHKNVTVKLDNTITATSKSATTVAEIQTEINKQLTAAGSKASVTNASGIFTVGTSETGGAGAVGISGTDIGFVSFAASARVRGTNLVSVATNTARVASGSDAVNGGQVNTNRQSFATQYKAILTQIDQLASDASYNGVNLLNDGSASNKLHINFNEKGTSSIDIQGQDATATGLALKSSTGSTEADAGFQTDADINAAISRLSTATGTLRQQASQLGSNLTVVQNRQDFTKNLINVLQTGSANLTNADLNEEAANSQALSTRQSLAISALSLANQSQQGVLQLLR